MVRGAARVEEAPVAVASLGDLRLVLVGHFLTRVVMAARVASLRSVVGSESRWRDSITNALPYLAPTAMPTSSIHALPP